MNEFAKSHFARRGLGRVVPIAAPVAIVVPRVVRRRRLVGAWRLDPVANRPVCFWFEHWSREDRAGEDSGDPAGCRRLLAGLSEPIAAERRNARGRP
jgi:hypothetical protein